MAHSKQAHKGSHLFPEYPKITCCCTAGDMQFKSVLPRAMGMAYQHTECKRHYDRSLDWLACYVTYILILIISLFCQIIYSSIRGLFILKLNGLARVQQSEIL